MLLKVMYVREQINISTEKVVALAIKTPGVKIDRDTFLKNELNKYYSKDIIDKATLYNPASAGIPKERINNISKHVINYETTKVTAVSTIASMPGGVAAIPAATADMASYFAFILRVVQKLAYLYGFEELELTEESINSETMNFIMVFLGVMFGVQGATSALGKVADSLAKHVAKNLANKALTKGAVYPIVKTVAKKLGMQMTKQIFADSVASAIPIAGGVLSGGLTFIMFRPCCMRLRKTLMSYNLCNPKFYNVEPLKEDIIVKPKRLRCERCGKFFNYASSADSFETATMLSYDNLKPQLCGSCAIEAVESQEEGVYYETCEVCGRRFDFIEEASNFELAHPYGNGTKLSDTWDPSKRIMCCNCAIDWENTLPMA